MSTKPGRPVTGYPQMLRPPDVVLNRRLDAMPSRYEARNTASVLARSAASVYLYRVPPLYNYKDARAIIEDHQAVHVARELAGRGALEPSLLGGFAGQLSPVDRSRFLKYSAYVELDCVLAQVDFFTDVLISRSIND